MLCDLCLIHNHIGISHNKHSPLLYAAKRTCSASPNGRLEVAFHSRLFPFFKTESVDDHVAPVVFATTIDEVKNTLIP